MPTSDQHELEDTVPASDVVLHRSGVTPLRSRTCLATRTYSCSSVGDGATCTDSYKAGLPYCRVLDGGSNKVLVPLNV